MKSLAKSAGTASADSDLAAAPMIPEKPIDREILHYSDNGALARVQAANDRANLYASERAGRGLFTLPEEKNYVANASPAMRDAGSRAGERNAENAEMTVPPPSAREFWSRPVATRDSGKAAANVPEDVSAMAGPARRGDDAVNPPAPTRAPARSVRDNFILPPDDMPGVFMAGEEEPTEAPPARARRNWFGMLRRDKGDALGAPPASSRDGASASAAGPRPRAEVTQRGPMLLNIDKLVGMNADAPTTAAVSTAPSSSMPRRELAEQRFAAIATEAFPPIAPGARIVSSEGMNFEPLPEPIPLAKFNSMVLKELEAGPAVAVTSTAAARATARRENARKPATRSKQTAHDAGLNAAPVLPLPAALIRSGGDFAPKAGKPAAAPAIPELTETKTAAKIPGAVEFAKVEKALAPLPDLAAMAPAPTKTAAKAGRKDKVVVAMPAPMPDALPTPEAAAAKAALLEFSPEAMDEAFAELNKSDFFKTDFWDPAAKTQRKADASAPQSATLPALPELIDPAGAKTETLPIPMPPPFFDEEKSEEPQKITLQPVRKTRMIPELEEIDSATEVPPLKF
jgi:hypothetical protein